MTDNTDDVRSMTHEDYLAARAKLFRRAAASRLVFEQERQTAAALDALRVKHPDLNKTPEGQN